MIIMGIDPGLTGAVAIIYDNNIEIYDCPIFQKMKTGERTTYDIDGMHTLMGKSYKLSLSKGSSLVVLEQLQPMPHNGSIANYSSGLGFGLWRMAIAAFEMPCLLVSPRKWKKAVGLTASKDDSRQRAIELYPSIAQELKLKKHHGRAEALLLAEYGRRTYNGENISK